MKNNSIANTALVYTLSITADLSGIPVLSIRLLKKSYEGWL
jgi:hypothetical protein